MQKFPHLTVSHNSMRLMIKCLNPLTIMRLLSVITRFRISEVVVIGVYFSSSLFWHSSRYERTQLETVAPDMPYSVIRLAIVRPS